MAIYVISGVGRGIGLELARQLAARGDEVVGLCRRGNEQLDAPGIRVIEDIDVTSNESMRRLNGALGDTGVDVLINNAGVMHRQSLERLDFERMRDQFEVNALGPLRLTAAVAPRLSEGSKVAIVTSRMGSVADNASGGHYGYRASKAAANMIGVSLAHDLKPRGIAVALLHPGLVATDMTEHNGISTAEAAAGLIERIDELELSTTGRFWHANGERLPW